jgi:hypothetical protein
VNPPALTTDHRSVERDVRRTKRAPAREPFPSSLALLNANRYRWEDAELRPEPQDVAPPWR